MAVKYVLSSFIFEGGINMEGDIYLDDFEPIFFKEIKDIDISNNYFTKITFEDNSFVLYQNSRIKSMHIYEQENLENKEEQNAN